MFSGKIKVLMKNIFSSHEVDFGLKFRPSGWYIAEFPLVPFFRKIDQLSDKIALARRVFGAGRASDSRKLGRVIGSDLQQSYSLLRADLVLQKSGSLFFVNLTDLL